MALQEKPLAYASERLFWDADFQQELLGDMVALGREVEVALGGEPQVMLCRQPMLQLACCLHRSTHLSWLGERTQWLC